IDRRRDTVQFTELLLHAGRTGRARHPGDRQLQLGRLYRRRRTRGHRTLTSVARPTNPIYAPRRTAKRAAGMAMVLAMDDPGPESGAPHVRRLRQRALSDRLRESLLFL